MLWERRCRVAIALAVVVLTGAGGCTRPVGSVDHPPSPGGSASPSPEARPVASPCVLSRSKGEVPPPRARLNLDIHLAASRRGWVHAGSLWVQLPKRSVLPAYGDAGSARVHTKLGWFRAAAGQVFVSGAPVGGAPALFRSDVGTVPEYGPTGFTPSGLVFGRPGCWRLTGRLGRDTLVLTLRVVRWS